MNGISGYQVYQNNYSKTSTYSGVYEKPEAVKQETDVLQPKDVYEKSSVKETKKEAIKLSEDAKALLERLKKNYNNMDFTIASYHNAEEAQKYLQGGRKQFSVLIDPQLLEEMAADEKTEKKYTDLLESATTQLMDMQEELPEEKAALHMGISFGADGSTMFFAELEKSSERQREHIEKVRAEKKEEEKKEDEKNKRVRFYADTAEELLEKIKNIDWDKVKAEEKMTRGSVIDLGV